MKKTHVRFRFVIFYISLVMSPSYAHDFWLEAHPFYTQVNNTVELSVHVGNEYIGDSLPNIPNWYSDFSLYINAKKIPIEGSLGRDPAGYFTPRQKGTYAIGYQSDFTYIEIDSATFNKYLQEEGLQNAIDYRQNNKQTQTQGNEDYIRHVKTLVQSGDAFDVDYSATRFGYELEIIALENPYRKSINDHIDFKVLHKTEPEHGIMVIAFSKQKPELVQRVRSDHRGIARIKLDQYGPWLIKAVKIIKLENQKADWQSHWASLTFEIKRGRE